MDPGADAASLAALRELADKLSDPYAKFSNANQTTKQDCKEHFEALTRLLEDKPNRDFWINTCNGLALCAFLMPCPARSRSANVLRTTILCCTAAAQQRSRLLNATLVP